MAPNEFVHPEFTVGRYFIDSAALAEETETTIRQLGELSANDCYTEFVEQKCTRCVPILGWGPYDHLVTMVDDRGEERQYMIVMGFLPS